jgi:hypothetical protein
MKITLTRFLVLFCCLHLFFLASAQLNYQTGGFGTVASTYADLGTNGSVITMTDNDFGRSLPLPIGFTFRFNGTDYDSLVVYVDGFVKLGRDTASSQLLFTTFVQPPAGGPFNSTLSSDTNLIVPFGQDLWNRGGAQNPEFRIHTSGFPGVRVCTIQWKNVSDKLQNAASSQYDTINFQLKLYESTNWIEFIYGRWVPSTNTSTARFAACGLKGNSTLSNQLLTVTKGSTVSWQLPTINAGNYINNAVNYGNNVGVARPAPDPGRIYRFTPVVFNDIAVNAVYALGKIARNAYVPDSIRAAVSNPGVNAQSNVSVTLTISGANAHTATSTIPFIAPNTTAIVAFPPYAPANYGNSLITVSVPSDDNNANNSKDYGLSVSERSFAYTDTLQPAGQAWGSTAFVFWGCRYQIQGTRRITTVRSFLFSNSDALGDTLCAFILDTAGNILGRSPAYVVQASDLGTWLTFTITNPPTLSNRAFLAGVSNGVQTSNLFLGTVQNEVPLRANPNLFFQIVHTAGNNITNIPSGAFFGTPNLTNLGRLVMECTADQLPANDVGISAGFPSNNLTVPTNTAIPLTALISNFGTASRPSGIPVRYRINNGAIIGPVNSAATIPSNDTASVLFSGTNALNFATPGTYNIKIWTQLTGDAATFNDTINLVVNAINSGLTIPYRAENIVLGTDWSSPRNVNNIIKQVTAVTPNGLSNSNTLTFDNFSFFGEGIVCSPMLSFNGLSNPVLNFHVAHAPNTFAVSDSLEVRVSTNGGYTYTTMYTRIGQGGILPLGTVAPQGTLFTPASSIEWRQEVIDLSAFANAPRVVIAFRNVSGTGNRIYISNVQVTNPQVVSSFPISGLGSYPSGAAIVSFTSVGNANGVMVSSFYHGLPPSVASPVYASNSVATTNNSSIFTPSNVSNRYWNFTYSGVGTGNLPATIGYQLLIDYATLFGVNNGDSVYVMRRASHNSSWIALNTTRVGTSLLTGIINSFGDFALGSSSTSSNPLPADLLDWKGLRSKEDVLLNWTTSSELNNRGFDIERSFDGEVFNKLNFIKGQLNSNTTNFYAFTDAQQKQPAYYRLKQLDADGAFTYSPIIHVSGMEEPIVISPNPFSKDVFVTNTSGAIQAIALFDVKGKKHFELNNPSENVIQLKDEVISLPAGIYFVRIITANQSYSYRIVKH